jgi:hypothetical protein
MPEDRFTKLATKLLWGVIIFYQSLITMGLYLEKIDENMPPVPAETGITATFVFIGSVVLLARATEHLVFKRLAASAMYIALFAVCIATIYF